MAAGCCRWLVLGLEQVIAVFGGGDGITRVPGASRLVLGDG